MTTLRTKLIRLAHQQPSLRPHLLPLLKTAALDASTKAKLMELDAEIARLDLAERADKLAKDIYKPRYDAENLSRSARELKEVAEEMAEARTEIETVALRLKGVRRTIRTLLEG